MPHRTSAHPPFRTISSRALSPVILTCEHASRDLPLRVPRDPRLEAILRSHWGWDIGAWDVARRVARALGASAIGARYSRLYVDLNRAVGDSTLVRKEAEGVILPWNARLGAAAIERRVAACHVPYHTEIDRWIFRRVLRGVRPLLFSVHSFTPVLGRERRNFDAGILFAKHESEARKIGTALASAGLSVRYNEPYSGLAGMMYAAERHGSHHAVPCLELELNQALFRDRRAASTLARIVARSLRSVAAPGRRRATSA